MITIFDRIGIKMVAVGAGLCGIALAFGTGQASAGGYECVETSAGEVPAAAGAPACAPISAMAGVPMALPGPIPPIPVVPPPVIPPVPPLVPPIPPVPPLVPPIPPVPPVVPVVPAGAPLVPMAGPVAGLPLETMGGLAGKGDPIGPPPSGAPVAGQPISPGPTA